MRPGAVKLGQASYRQPAPVKRLSAIAVAGVLFAATVPLSAAHAASINCNTTTAVPGGVANTEVSLVTEPGETVTGTQNDLQFDEAIFTVTRPDSMTSADCRINPAIGPGTSVGKNLFASVLANPSRLRGFVLALSNLGPIPDGLLYSCRFHVAPNAPLGNVMIANINLGVAPRGEVSGTDCQVEIALATPTATPTPPCTDDDDCQGEEVCLDGSCLTPTPTRTPIGFCDDDDNCPDQDVCVDNTCTRVTPTPTPPGFCRDGEDCPEGEVCVDESCATPTPPGFCTDDRDCGASEVCVDGACATATPTRTPQGFCRDDDDCVAGQVCLTNQCTELTPTPEGCDGDDDCTGGQVCVGRSCAAPTATRTPDGFCHDDDDCDAGEVCVGSQCTQPTTTPTAAAGNPTPTRTPLGFCVDNIDCPEGQTCIGSSCVTPQPKDDDDNGCQVVGGQSGATTDLLVWLIPPLWILARRRRYDS